jgi:FKBP-type peptidyl-prolyl cis-trans isomerase FkpA
MKKAAIAFVVASAFSMTACQQQSVDPLLVEEVKFENEAQKQAYAFGASVGTFVEQRMGEQADMNVMLDKELVLKGFTAAMQGNAQFDLTQIQTLNSDLDKVMREAAVTKAQVKIEKGKTWLAENAKNENITVTESGLQ